MYTGRRRQGAKRPRAARMPDSMLLVFSIAGSLLLLFIALPIAGMVFAQTPQSLADAVTDPAVVDSILLSMGTALAATLVAAMLGIPLAYVMARRDFPGKKFIQGMIDVPIVVPHTVAGIALLTVFGTHGMLGEPLSVFNIRFTDAVPGIVVAMLFLSAPFLVNYAREGFEGVDPRLENVARSLGTNKWGAFYRISLPLCYRHILTGAVMTWARAISEFGAVVIIAYYPQVATTLIYSRFLSFGLEDSSSIAVVLVLVCLGVFIGLRVLVSTGGRGRGR